MIFYAAPSFFVRRFRKEGVFRESSLQIRLRLVFTFSFFFAGTPAICHAHEIAHSLSKKVRLQFVSSLGVQHYLWVAPDRYVSSNSAISKVDIIAEVSPQLFVIVDTLASRPLGLSMCQAGTERTVRVVKIVARKPVEQSKLKVESCRQGIELANPGLVWDPAHSTLLVRWIIAPGEPRGSKQLMFSIPALRPQKI